MHRTRTLTALLVPLLLLAASCGGSDDEPAAEATVEGEPAADTSGGAFPVTVEHAFGRAEIVDEPERVVTYGWGSTEAAIALGVIPVAMSHQAYGGDADGVLTWVREAVEAQGAELPAVLPQSEEAPIEAIAAARPDLILAPYSGLTDAEYELLSQIAPTVAYPEEAWTTPWQDVIEIVGRSLGRSEDADALLADLDATLSDAAEATPELAGKTVAAVWDTGDTFYVYKPQDARVGFLLDLGLEGAPSVDELSGEGGEGDTFFSTLSHERVGELTSDVLVAYADTQAEMDSFLASPAAQAMAQVQEGRVAQIVGTELIAAMSPPTVLSLTWGLDAYVEALAASVAA